jgi:hypothetical protein
MPSISTLSIPPSIPAEAGILSAAIQLLAHVESLPPAATGVVAFGQEGLILVEGRNICWAVASGMKRRLSKLLRQQRSPPLELGYVEEVLRACQATGRPLGEALLADGQISEEGLRAALFSHITEAVARIAQSGARPGAFGPHAGAGYDPRFVFSTGEVLAALGARRNRALAAAARRHLRSAMLAGARGVAFVREDIGPVTVAVEGRPQLKLPEILELCAWACSLFDVAAVVDPGVRIATSGSSDANAVVAWRKSEVHYVIVCPNRATAALVTARVGASLDSGEEVEP